MKHTYVATIIGTPASTKTRTTNQPLSLPNGKRGHVRHNWSRQVTTNSMVLKAGVLAPFPSDTQIGAMIMNDKVIDMFEWARKQNMINTVKSILDAPKVKLPFGFNGGGGGNQSK